MRICNKCKEDKELSDFQFDHTSNGGLSTICKSCKNEMSKVRYKEKRIEILRKEAEKRMANPEKKRQQSKKTYDNHKDEIFIRRMIDRENNPRKFKGYWLKAKYGISCEDYDLLYIKQEGRCFICGTHSSGLKKPLCVDHCHTTNKVRSLLCTRCNTGIGSFKENTEIMEKAINYIKENLQ